MRKRILLIAAIMVLTFAGAACGSGNGNTDTSQNTNAGAAADASDGTGDNSANTGNSASSGNSSNTTPAEESTEAAKESDSESTPNASDGTMTGIVDENKGFMITVISDSDGEAYVFPLTDAQSTEFEKIKANDKVTVSYSNGLPTPDNTETVVIGIISANE